MFSSSSMQHKNDISKMRFQGLYKDELLLRIGERFLINKRYLPWLSNKALLS